MGSIIYIRLYKQVLDGIRLAGKELGRQAVRQLGKQACRLVGKEAGRQAGRQAGGQTKVLRLQAHSLDGMIVSLRFIKIFVVSHLFIISSFSLRLSLDVGVGDGVGRRPPKFFGGFECQS